MADLASSIKGLLESGDYADTTITCDGTTFKAHCAVVCSQSKVFAKMIDGQVKEYVLREIDLPNDELPVVAAMIQYLYTGDYWDKVGGLNCSSVPTHNPEPVPEPDLKKTATPQTEAELLREKEFYLGFPLLFNVQLYNMADIYDIPGLKLKANEKFKKAAAEGWNTAFFSDAVKKVWENTLSTDSILRDSIVAIAVKHVHGLLDRGEFYGLMSSRGDFCLDVLSLTLGRSIGPVQKEKASKKKKRWV